MTVAIELRLHHFKVQPLHMPCIPKLHACV